jgi:uncharacterized protein
MKNRNPFGSEEKAIKFCKSHNISYLGVFGSYARAEDTGSSDIDLLIKIDHYKGSFSLFDLAKAKNELEDIFKKNVDLISNPNKYIIPYIEKDLITLYGKR